MVDGIDEPDVIERHVEHVDKMPADGPQRVVEGPNEAKFQPIDKASLAPGLTPPPTPGNTLICSNKAETADLETALKLISIIILKHCYIPIRTKICETQLKFDSLLKNMIEFLS